MKISLSVVIITFNEEKNLSRCLESVKPVADEIVVVDSFSTDLTEKICLNYGVRFLKHEFEGYAQQKRYASEQAKYSFILSLDADEVLSDELAFNIKKVKEEWDADAYTFNRLNNYCGKWIHYSGWYPDRKIRLWDSRKGGWKGENLHEYIGMAAGCKIAHIKGDLLHYSYNSISQHADQTNRFSEIAAMAYHKKGRRIPFSLTLIRMLMIFIKKFFIKLGFLDGYYGIVISIMSVYSVFLKDTKLRELNKKG